MLYQMETNGNDPEGALAAYCETFPYQQDVLEYTKSILSGVKKNREIIDGYIQSACEHWRLDRITYVDMGIMRLGTYEMLFSPDVPPKVAIDEAIEIGKKYGSEDSREFINGVLDKIMRDHYKDKGPE
ncbi:MAG: transcription antitermination factor NusB [Syntrophus sp. (in: bacteria)]|nr:transcription antitermination factor NusB [Syntrophus sp. (in: bacteria)]